MTTNEFEILLIEDNVDDAELTMRALKKSNIANTITHLYDGEEALDYIFCTGKYQQRKDGHPKLILLDLRLPKIDGIELLTKIKEDSSTKSIPVVILTSSIEDPDMEKCYNLGAESYIVKPVGFENFAKALARLGVYWMLIDQLPGEN